MRLMISWRHANHSRAYTLNGSGIRWCRSTSGFGAGNAAAQAIALAEGRIDATPPLLRGDTTVPARENTCVFVQEVIES